MASVVRLDPPSPLTGVAFSMDPPNARSVVPLRRRPERPSLAAMVEGEIIPRLMLAHGAATPARTEPLAAGVAAAEVEAFAPLTLRLEAGALLEHVEAILDRGVSIDTLFVELLAPAARVLGVWWEEDTCDFVEVTMGLWRLQEVVRELTSRSSGPGDPRGRGRAPRRALFAAMPGDQHDFGAIMVGEMFRRHGWDADIEIGAAMPDLLARIGGEHFDVIGLTLSCDSHSARLPSAIHALRSVSRNPRLRVMVGGRVFVDDPGLAIALGADATAPDARAALIVAGELVGALAFDTACCA